MPGEPKEDDMKDKIFVTFMGIWLLTQIIGLAVVGHKWPGTWVNVGAILIMGLAVSWQEFQSYRKKLK